MADDWYEYANAEHFWFRWRLHVIRALLPRAEAGTEILDVGCGSAVSRNQLEKYLNLPVHGCDVNLTALNLAGAGRGQLYCYDITARRPEWRGRFDLITLLDVLEHITDTAGFLAALAHHLKPGGRLLINVPAHPWLYGQYDQFLGHVKRYTKPLLRTELAAAGFRVQQWGYWGFSMIPLLLVRTLLSRNWPRELLVQKGFQPPSRAATILLEGLRITECLRSGRMPLGTSLMALARLEDDSGGSPARRPVRTA